MQSASWGRLRSPVLVWSLLVTLLTLTFGHFQNRGHLIGGEISLAKTLWLNLTIVCFLVVPGFLWRDRRIDPSIRTIYGFIFISFAVRGALELPILYLTDWWKCSYGIAHDLGTAAIVIALFRRVPDEGRDRYPGLLLMLVALMFVEATFAYAFCSVADPGSGIYFASNDAVFRRINIATWLAVVSGYAALGGLLLPRDPAESTVRSRQPGIPPQRRPR